MAKNIVTLRNAGSDIGNLLETLKALYKTYSVLPFTLDDSVNVAVDKGLMSSKGRKGADARARSYNENVSLDSMPMQFKAYAEMFRLLGWLRSESNQKRTTYRVTFMGMLLATGDHPKPLAEQCFLGIDLPNDVVDRDCENKVRLLWCYLRTMQALDAKGVKNEFIMLCHAIGDDENESEFEERLAELKTIRELKGSAAIRKRALAGAVERLAASAKPKRVQANTLGNSTRFTLSALKAFGWTNPAPADKIYKSDVYQLSDAALKLVGGYAKFYRPKCREVMAMAPTVREHLAKVGLVQLLKRAGYDTTKLEHHIDYEAAAKCLASELALDVDMPVLFSPYQALSPDELVRIFGNTIESTEVPDNENTTQGGIVSASPPQDSSVRITSVISLVDSTAQEEVRSQSTLINRINTVYQDTNSVEETVKRVFDEYATANLDMFYPTVVEAFCILGLDCILERPGQNGIRWDAVCRDPERSIPIEIKSPGEEETISVKAIRQALENRIVLTARKTYATKLEVSSFVVGYKYPNERAEVHELVSHVNNAFGIKLALFSFEALLRLVIKKIIFNKQPAPESFFSLIGLVEIEQ